MVLTSLVIYISLFAQEWYILPSDDLQYLQIILEVNLSLYWSIHTKFREPVALRLHVVLSNVTFQIFVKSTIKNT